MKTCFAHAQAADSIESLVVWVGSSNEIKTFSSPSEFEAQEAIGLGLTKRLRHSVFVSPGIWCELEECFGKTLASPELHLTFDWRRNIGAGLYVRAGEKLHLGFRATHLQVLEQIEIGRRLRLRNHAVRPFELIGR